MLADPTRAPLGRSDSVLQRSEIRTSSGSSLFEKAPISRPSFHRLAGGISFKLCTATSIMPSPNASSREPVKSTAFMARGTSCEAATELLMSPDESIGTISVCTRLVESLVWMASCKSCCIIFACIKARFEGRLPMRIVLLLPLLLRA